MSPSSDNRQPTTITASEIDLAWARQRVKAPFCFGAQMRRPLLKVIRIFCNEKKQSFD